jgi:hypothetical protein
MKYLDNPDNQEPTETNTDKYLTLEIPMTMAHYGEIAYLLENANWHVPDEDDLGLLDTDTPTELERRAVAIDAWQDYDAWEGGEDWLDGLPTQRLKDWVNGLPEYEAEPAHEWTMTSTEVFDSLRKSPTKPAYADIKCKNCDETYQVGVMF